MGVEREREEEENKSKYKIGGEKESERGRE
jgi:hypothetical protein